MSFTLQDRLHGQALDHKGSIDCSAPSIGPKAWLQQPWGVGRTTRRLQKFGKLRLQGEIVTLAVNFSLLEKGDA